MLIGEFIILNLFLAILFVYIEVPEDIELEVSGTIRVAGRVAVRVTIRVTIRSRIP